MQNNQIDLKLTVEEGVVLFWSGWNTLRSPKVLSLEFSISLESLRSPLSRSLALGLALPFVLEIDGRTNGT